MSPNVVTKILLKSTSQCLPNDMFIIFFGYMVVKISIMEDYVPDLKYNRNLIKFYKSCILIFHEFLMNLNASTSKISISVSMSPNFVIKSLLKSSSKCLSNNMFIIFFRYVVVKISIMEDYVPELKYNRNLIEFYENCIFHEFLMDLNPSTSKI